MIKYLLSFILLLPVMLSCREESEFFNDCSCSKVSIKNGIEVVDKLNHFSIIYPDSSWVPSTELNDSGNHITGGLVVDENDIIVINITELKKSNPWPAKDEQLADMIEKYNVIESSTVMLHGSKQMWNLVKEESGDMLSLYVTIESNRRDSFYTLLVSVSSPKYSEFDICTLENIIFSFKESK